MSEFDRDDDPRPRPIVEVINLSAFPVTITAINFETDDDNHYFWKNPDITAPYGKLPARLPPREALTAVGIPVSRDKVREVASFARAVAHTACGERIEGMTDAWRKTAAELVAELET